ncbi:MAG: iron ABC transporter permease [Ilumatobacteraceae bacterium]|jgi:iron complex transport system permease protein
MRGGRGWQAWYGWFLGACLLLVVAVALGVMIGPAGTISRANWNVVSTVRLPRVALGGLVGGTLALAGASYQGVFRNPLVDTYQLGVGAGAGLGATIAMTIGITGSRMGLNAGKAWGLIDPLPLAAFLGGLGAVVLTYVVGAGFGGNRASLVLAGVAVTAVASALQALILQRNNDVIRQVYNWILGSLSSARWADVRLALPYTVVAGAVLMLHRRHLDLLRVGEEEAQTLGAPVRRIRLTVVIAATMATAAVISVSGLIGFVGLVVPHVVRMLSGSSYRSVLPISVVLGAAFLILVDIPGRALMSGAEIPIGVVTAMLGGPFFILLLRTRRAGV